MPTINSVTRTHHHRRTKRIMNWQGICWRASEVSAVNSLYLVYQLQIGSVKHRFCYSMASTRPPQWLQQWWEEWGLQCTSISSSSSGVSLPSAEQYSPAVHDLLHLTPTPRKTKLHVSSYSAWNFKRTMRFKYLHGFQCCQAIPLVHLPTLPYQEISAQEFVFNIFPKYITYPKINHSGK